MPIEWRLAFDWDGDGSLAWDECARVTALAIERGRQTEFEMFDAGKCVLTLDNNDRRFDPWYAGSPLHGLVLPRRAIKVQGMDTDTNDRLMSGDDYLAWDDGLTDNNIIVVSGGFADLFAGRIEDIEPAGGIGNRTVLITAYDGLRDLAAVDVLSVLGISIRTDEAITAVLDAAGWPLAARDLDAGNDELGYWWTPGGETAKKICADLARSEFGAFFVSAAGLATFKNRHNYNTGAVSGTLDQADMADVLLNQPWEAVYNVVTVRCNPLKIVTMATLWTLEDDNVYVAPGGSVDLWTEYRGSTGACAGRNVITPVANVDYTASTLAGVVEGDTTNMTASMSVTADIYSTAAKLTISNAHRTTGFNITLLRIRGDAIIPTPTSVRREDVASQAVYGKRALTFDVPWQQSVNTATDLADTLRTFYAAPKTPMVCLLDNVQPDIMLGYELCDRIRVTVPEYSIDQIMWVNALALKTGMSMQDVKLELTLGPTDTLYWLLGEAGVGELGETTRLGY